MLDELGLDLTDKLKELPSTGGTLSAGQSTDKQPLADVDADLQARLENLRREWNCWTAMIHVSDSSTWVTEMRIFEFHIL